MTALFVELIVIGIGALAWVMLAVMTVFGYAWIRLEPLMSLSGLIPVLTTVYVLGIVVDRLADRLFGGLADRLRTRSFPTSADYERARNIVYSKSSLMELIEYNRSRLRICRGWALNCILALVTFDAFVIVQAPAAWPRAKLLAAGTVLLSLLLIGVFHAWLCLATDAFGRLAQQAAILRDGS